MLSVASVEQFAVNFVCMLSLASVVMYSCSKCEVVQKEMFVF